jgi:predicted methyltransferase
MNRSLPLARALPLPVVLLVVLGCAHEHEPLVHRFEKADAWVKEFDDPARDAWQQPDMVLAAMGIGSGMTVADVGAGTGYFLPYLSRAVGPQGRVLALDIEPDMVRYMRERATREGFANVETRVVTSGDPALAAGKVDRVLVVDTWHHIDDREAYAEKIADALVPGGAVYVVDFTAEATHGPPKHHRLAREQVARELASAGLFVEPSPVALPEQYIVVARKAQY